MRADLHIHSCLSPCGSLDMSPRAIAGAAVAAGLEAVALTDHNSALNLPAFDEACRARGLARLFGVEVCTAEEIHALCLFDRLGRAMDFGAELERHLPRIRNQPEKMGDQVYVDIDENILGEVEWFLGVACDWPLTTLAEIVIRRGGLFIPSHVDRPSHSLLSQLGYIPDLPYDALEVTSVKLPPGRFADALARYPKIASSDAHYPGDIGRRFVDLPVAHFDVEHLRRALRQSVPAAEVVG